MKKHYFLLGIFLILGIIKGASKGNYSGIINLSSINEATSFTETNFGESGNGALSSNSYITCTLTARTTVTANETCNGGSSGSVSSTVSGGTSPYTYSWSPTGGTKSTASALSAGTYTIYATDKNGCSATARATITQPAANMTVRTSVTANETCFGGSTGKATATVSGGTSPYTYSWSPTGGTKSAASALSAGTYTIHVTGHSGCSATASAIITQPAGMTITASVTANETCGGGLTGKTSVIVSGGTSPYTYSWSPSGGTKSTASALSAGTYTIHVTGHTACTGTASVIVTQPATMTVIAAVTANVGCRSGSTGSISATPSGGTSPYTYSWAATGGTNPIASALSAGTYTIHVTDHNGCTATSRATITQPASALTVTATVSANTNCSGASTGSISSNASGGTSPYTYSWSPSGGSTSNASALSAGTYTINITDHNGCAATAGATITQSSSNISVTATVTSNTNCGGSSSGSISSSISGGTSPYTYSWSPTGGNGSTARLLSAGTYTINVYDNNGCSASSTAIVTQPASNITVSVTVTSNASCSGVNNGSISTTVTGGSSPYTYSWSPSGGNGTSANSLSAGTYTVNITDNNGCNASAGAIISQPASNIIVTASVTGNAGCNGSNTGSISSNISGGTSPYTYTWSPSGGNSPNAGALSAGTYTINVTDNNGCNASATAIITQATSNISVTTTITGNATCGGASNGSISANTSGGTSPYTYLWSPAGGNGSNANALSAGTYTINFTDNNGCSASATGVITQAASTVMVTTTVTANESCSGASTGSTSASVSGGTVPYTYSWSPSGGSNSNANGLSAGTYTVYASDNNGCNASATAVITQPASNLTVNATVNTNESCNGANTGSISSSVSGGTSPYTYLWSPAGGSNFSANGLGAATYTLTVTDHYGCATNVLATITQPASINVSANATTNVNCNGGNTGVASCTVSGGVSPYTYSWSNSQTSSTATGLTTATYTVTVTDHNGCSVTDGATITQPIAINASANATTNVNCNGGNTGVASCTVTGGASPYTYLWSNSQTSSIASGLSAATYTVTVTDHNGCSVTDGATITQPSAINVSANATANETCSGGNIGIAICTVSGGVSPYTFSWSNNQTTSTASGLTAATYTVTVTDHNGCSVTDGATITQPVAINASANATANVNCNGGNTGVASCTVSGGVSPYTFSWSNNQTSSTASGLTAATYTVTVTDHNGCSITDGATITQPAAINASANATANVNCGGGNTGVASCTVSGGTSPYTYSWSNSQTSSTATGLTAATYTVTITDHNGCSTTDGATITQPAAINASANATANVNCGGGNTGVASCTVSGGTSPYTYSWSNSQTSSTATGLTAATYTVTITDHNGCSITDGATITQPTAINLSATAITHVNCFGGNNGAASCTVSGGSSPYTYSWSNSQTLSTATGLTAATYTVTVTDHNGCSTTDGATITQPASMSVTASVTAHETCNGGISGSVSSTVSGGTSPFTYSWSPSGGSNSTAGALSAGTYTIHVTGNTGCTATATASITQPALATITFSVTAITCNGAATGKAIATLSGGTSPYTYSWSPSGGSTSTASGLTAGTYTVHVTGHTGCSSTSSVVITQPVAISISPNVTSVSCNGGSNGSASVTPSGGTSPYTYSWSGSGTSSTKTGLVAGTYTLKVTDKNSCTATVSITVTQPVALGISISARTFPLCNNTKGTITANPASGGTSPYTYSWSSGGGINLTASSLGAGTYTITVTDNHGCTAIASATITQPSAIRDSIVNYLSCGSGLDSSKVGVNGGVPPYTYSWSAGGTKAAQTGLSAGTYTVTITDFNGCTATNIAAIITLTPPATPIIAPLTPDSIGFKVTNPTHTASYVWTLTDYTGSYAGIGDSAYLPVWPRRAILTFYADSGTSCQAVASIHITHNAGLISAKPYPRWSNRGMYLEWGTYYLDSTYKVHDNEVTPVVNYVRNNHITYVLIDGLQANGQKGGIFGVDTAGVNAANAANLISFIDSLKTRGGVKEVGIVCYHSQPYTDLDSNANSILNFNLNNYLENVNATNYGLPWNEKIDVLSMDQEFWLNIKNTTSSSKDYMYSVEDFHQVHMPMLKSMYRAAHECSANNLRVEDYIETPLDPWGLTSDTALYQLKAGAMELDSIGIYTDRLLLSSYTAYHTVLWNEGDFIQIDSEMGLDRYHAYYKKEIWPVFSAENSDSGTCTKAYYYRGDNFSGSNLCTAKKIDTAEWIEKQYFDSLSYSENHSPSKVFTNNLNGRFYQTPMGADTNFQILGTMWFDYKTMIDEGIKFDTNTSGRNKGYLRFYVTLGHDTQWVPPNTPPITITARVHGGKGPYSYMWYDMNNGKVLLFSTTTNTYTMGYNALLGNYPVSKLGVVVKDAGDSTSTDYIYVYKACKNGNGVRTPVTDKQEETRVEEIAAVENNVKVYPNPNTGQFTVAISGNDESPKNIEIYTMLGQQVLAQPLLNPRGNNTVYMATQANGIYFYRVMSESGVLVGEGKIMVQR